MVKKLPNCKKKSEAKTLLLCQVALFFFFIFKHEISLFHVDLFLWNFHMDSPIMVTLNLSAGADSSTYIIS